MVIKRGSRAPVQVTRGEQRCVAEYGSNSSYYYDVTAIDFMVTWATMIPYCASIFAYCASGFV